MDVIKNCPVCDSSKFTKFLDSKDFFLTSEEFKIDICTNCGFKFTNPRPDKKALSKYYESIDYISHSNINKGIINKLYRFVRQFTIKNKIRLITKFVNEGNVLDIGCGSGEFLNELKKQNWNVTGIEPNESARKFAAENYGINALEENDFNNLEKNSFDVITLWHVLEHVFDIEERILQIKKIISKKGILVIALPNPDSLDAKIYGKYWAAYDLPRHLYHFNKATVERLFNKYGFSIIKLKPMFFDSFYVSMLSEKYKTGKVNYPKAFFNGLRSNFFAAFNNKNYSSIIYILNYT
ncbi:MAG: methyltransferase domain-containing protein [Bacteroidetes bacterium]|nr:methyltransferase domain-containing protein [Bacteroidota bacterium]MBL7105433.1 methyltransferase domain-containing protein [Bacteroidales bacterium]